MTKLPNAAPKPRKKPKKTRPPLQRSRTPIARGPVKRKNAKRAKANHARAYGDHAKVIRKMACLVCDWPHSEAAHVGNGGLSRKGDRSKLVPLCGPHLIWQPAGSFGRFIQVEGCHGELHRQGIKTFEREHGVDLASTAARLWTEFHAATR